MSQRQLLESYFSSRVLYKWQLLESGLPPATFVQERVRFTVVVMITGYELNYAPARISSEEHRSCADGRASTRHLHGKIARAARCLTVKVPAESAGAVAR